MYIKHLPHGFFEEQLRGYFSQFGAITRLRLSRSSKTLGSKGYAYIEFRYPEVAEIAADAMNNYIMFKNIVKSRYIPPSEIKHDYFRSGVKMVRKDGQKQLTSKSIEAREFVVKNTNKLMTDEDQQKRVAAVGSKWDFRVDLWFNLWFKNFLLRIRRTKRKLASLGIDFDMDEVAGDMGGEVTKEVMEIKPATVVKKPKAAVKKSATVETETEPAKKPKTVQKKSVTIETKPADIEPIAKKPKTALKKKPATIKAETEPATIGKKSKTVQKKPAAIETAETNQTPVETIPTRRSSRTASKVTNPASSKSAGKKHKK